MIKAKIQSNESALIITALDYMTLEELYEYLTQVKRSPEMWKDLKNKYVIFSSPSSALKVNES